MYYIFTISNEKFIDRRLHVMGTATNIDRITAVKGSQVEYVNHLSLSGLTLLGTSTVTAKVVQLQQLNMVTPSILTTQSLIVGSAETPAAPVYIDGTVTASSVYIYCTDIHIPQNGLVRAIANESGGYGSGGLVDKKSRGGGHGGGGGGLGGSGGAPYDSYLTPSLAGSSGGPGSGGNYLV